MNQKQVHRLYFWSIVKIKFIHKGRIFSIYHNTEQANRVTRSKRSPSREQTKTEVAKQWKEEEEDITDRVSYSLNFCIQTLAGGGGGGGRVWSEAEGEWQGSFSDDAMAFSVTLRSPEPPAQGNHQMACKEPHKSPKFRISTMQKAHNQKIQTRILNSWLLQIQHYFQKLIPNYWSLSILSAPPTTTITAFTSLSLHLPLFRKSTTTHYSSLHPQHTQIEKSPPH